MYCCVAFWYGNRAADALETPIFFISIVNFDLWYIFVENHHPTRTAMSLWLNHWIINAHQNDANNSSAKSQYKTFIRNYSIRQIATAHFALFIREYNFYDLPVHNNMQEHPLFCCQRSFAIFKAVSFSARLFPQTSQGIGAVYVRRSVGPFCPFGEGNSMSARSRGGWKILVM